MELATNSFLFINFISQPWHWAVSGAMIALTMLTLTWMGRSFGVSMTFLDACAVAGAGKRNDFFRIDLKNEYWRMSFVLGGLIGGFLATTFLASPEPVAISPETIGALEKLGISYPDSDEQGYGFVPTSIFNFQSIKGIALALAGGFLVGFGARYGDGCTSGHAISGLSHLQLPSLITVIGFFIGGLLMTHFLLPILFA